MPKRLYLKIYLIIILIFVLSIPVLSQNTTLEDYNQRAQELYKKLSPNEVFNFILSGIPKALSHLSSSFGLSLSLITIYHIFAIFKDNLKTCENLFEMVADIMIVLCTAIPFTECLAKVGSQLSALCAYMLSFIPTSAILHAATGNTVSAAVSTSTNGASITILEFISISIILPLIKAVFSVTCVNQLLKRVNFSSMTNTLRSVCLWITGLSFTIFTGLISISSLLSSSADTLSMKGMKFAAGRLIPIAGGMISESLRTVISSAAYIKSVTGISGIVFIIYSVLPCLCILLCTKLYFYVLCCYCGFTGKNSISGYLESVGNILNIVVALFCGCAISFIIMLFIFIRTTVSL